MNENYKLVGAVNCPPDDDGTAVTISVYNIMTEKELDFLMDVEAYEQNFAVDWFENGEVPEEVKEAETINNAILSALGIENIFYVEPGASFHLYSAKLLNGYAIVSDTWTLNI
jgi:hypothetical protein